MTLLQVLPWLTQRQISAAAHRLSGQSETLVVGVCSVPVDLRAYWCSTCPVLLRDPRRIRIDPRNCIIPDICLNSQYFLDILPSLSLTLAAQGRKGRGFLPCSGLCLTHLGGFLLHRGCMFGPCGPRMTDILSTG